MPITGISKPTKLALKHELEKPDNFLSFIEEAVITFEKYKRNFLIALGGIGAVLLIYGVYSFVSSSVKASASFAEYEANQIFRGENNISGGQIAIDNSQNSKYKTDSEQYNAALEKYKKITEKYQSTPSGQRAAMGVANSYFKLEKYDEAIKSYDKFVKSFPNSDFSYFAARNSALCYESKGELDKALNVLNSTLNNSAFSGMGKMSYNDMGRIYERKKEFKKALESYKGLLGFYQEGSLKEEIEKKIEGLESRIKSDTPKKS